MRRTVITSAVILILAVGCSPYVTVKDLNSIYKGMTKEEVRDELPNAREGSKVFSFDGVDYEIDHYMLQTGHEEQTSSYYRTANTGENYGTVNNQVQVKEETVKDEMNMLIFLYHNNSLIYWGMISDFWKSEDPKMEKLAPSLTILFSGETITKVKTNVYEH